MGKVVPLTKASVLSAAARMLWSMARLGELVWRWAAWTVVEEMTGTARGLQSRRETMREGMAPPADRQLDLMYGAEKTAETANGENQGREEGRPARARCG